MINITNASNSIRQFYEELEQIDLLNENRLRPDWDTYFMVTNLT
jgi:dCMP deaminase